MIATPKSKKARFYTRGNGWVWFRDKDDRVIVCGTNLKVCGDAVKSDGYEIVNVDEYETMLRSKG